jgi:hypothetical protein
MAQSFVTDQGTLVIPQAVASIQVAQANSGLATSGVLMLVGEADAGPDYSVESDLSENAYGPDQLAEVVAKYKSGPIVDAFRGASVPANDTNITGSFARAILVKTNPSGKAQSNLKKFDGSNYSVIADRSYGKLGNLINFQVTAKSSEVKPTTGKFAFLPPIAATNIDLRVNGGAAQAVSISAQMTPAAFKAAVDAIAGIDVDGGVDLAILGTSGSPISANIALTVVSGTTVQIDLSTNFGAVPSAGDTLWIPAGSALAGAGSANCGSYIVTSASAASITARKLIDHTGTPAQLTSPVNVASTATSVNTTCMAFSAIEIHLINSVDPIAGIGKSLEINELTSGTGLLSYICYTLGTSGPAVATWISKASAPKVISSASEYVPLLTAARQSDSISEELSAGGAIALQIGYKGTTATLVNDGVNLTITVTGGLGSSPAAIKLADYPTIAEVATYISTLTGFTAAPGTAVMGQQPSSSLDQGTFTFGSTHGANTGRIKQDAYKFFNKVKNDGVLVQISANGNTQPAAGLPAPQAIGYLSGGSRGATTNTTFNAAIDALELVRGNFLVPLFSRDAVEDIADNITDASSSYTIANVHAYTRSHVLKMSTLKRKRNRQAFLSIRDTFQVAKDTAANIAAFRCSMTFQDVKDVGSSGVVQFKPWMAAVKAAGMQAAGFYRPIVRKGINITGALQAKGDFNDQDDTKMEDALIAGLLPIRRDETGGLYWVSDQTTYGKDSNFVFNSIQATYVADVIALTTAQRMEQAFVGQSVADVSATLALSTLEAIMEDFRRLKLIAPSIDAPKGFKDAKVKITGPAMVVSVEVKLAGAIYFIPISFLVSQVSQAAG